jgi:hypothetical protein
MITLKIHCTAMKYFTVRFADFGKPDLVKIQNGGLVLGLNQFPVMPQKSTLDI